MGNRLVGQEGTGQRPNIFIVGSMKCGTTILYDFLTSHAEIAGGTEKEIHYFSLFNDRGEDWYLSQFPPAEGARFRLDASPTYFDMCLTVPTAERIKAFNPDAKIIILIRNPIQRATSHFNHLKKINKLEVLSDISFDSLIARDWPETSDRKVLENIRRMIVDFSRYNEKVRKFVDVFGRDNVFVVANEDLRAHGELVVRQVYGFLGLEAPTNVDFTRQSYLHGSDKITISQANYFALLEEFGDDYYRVCRMGNHLRPEAEPGGPALNQPIGALVNEVGVGEDGWLFLASGSNNVLEMYLESEALHRNVVSRWHAIIEERIRRLAEFGTRYIHMMIPEKMTLLGDKLHWPINTTRSRGATFYRTAPSAIKANLIDLVGYMGRLSDREKYFHKTDSHWNFFGAFVAYQLICSVAGFSIRNELLNRPKTSGRLVLDLGSKLPDTPSEQVSFAKLRKDAEVISDAGLVRYKIENRRLDEPGLHVGSFVHFGNKAAPNSQRVMIFGDSFSEFRDHLLTGLMAETFRETIFIWSTQIDYKMVERYRPDVVFCFMTERFMDRHVDDSFDCLQYTEDVLARLRSGSSSKQGQ